MSAPQEQQLWLRVRLGERDRHLRAGDEAWAELCAALDAAPPEAPLHDPESPTWTSRDVYTHFMRVHSGSAAGIEAQFAGKPPPWPEGDENEINERWVTEDRALSLGQA